MKQITTTLNKIRQHSPCQGGWEKLLKSLGKTAADDEPLAFSRIAESNGIQDAVWCLRSICPEHDREVRLFAADCAEAVLHIYENKYPNDNRPRKAIEAARTFANGEINVDELAAAREAAWAACAAWAAAGDAAGAAAWGAAGAAAGEAAREAAWAAGYAARLAAWAAGAAWDAAREAARDAQLEMLKEKFS